MVYRHDSMAFSSPAARRAQGLNGSGPTAAVSPR